MKATDWQGCGTHAETSGTVILSQEQARTLDAKRCWRGNDDGHEIARKKCPLLCWTLASGGENERGRECTSGGKGGTLCV